MALAKRFEGFSRDFNVPSVDFNSLREVGIFNNPESIVDFQLDEDNPLMKLKDSAKAAKDLFNEGKEIYDGLQAKFDEITRFAKDTFNSIVDFASASVDMVKAYVADIFSGFPSEIKDLIMSVGNFCRNEALSDGAGVGNYRNNPNCGSVGGGQAKCPPGATQGLLGSIGTDIGRALSRGLNAIKKMVSGLASLLSLGYNSNLCNVLTSVLDKTGITDKSIIGVAAGVVLNKQGLKGNLRAAFDMAKSNIGNVGAMVPMAIPSTVMYMAKENNINATNVAHAASSIELSFDELDSGWRRDSDNNLSIAKLGNQNTEMEKAMEYRRNSATFDSNDLDAVSDDENVQFAAIYSAGTTNPTAPAEPPFQARMGTWMQDAIRETQANAAASAVPVSVPVPTSAPDTIQARMSPWMQEALGRTAH